MSNNPAPKEMNHAELVNSSPNVFSDGKLDNDNAWKLNTFFDLYSHTMVYQEIKIYWKDLNKWFDAVVVNLINGEHVVLYGFNTLDVEVERVNLQTLTFADMKIIGPASLATVEKIQSDYLDALIFL